MIQKKDDSFFQLSLTELAFILVFIVLLLLGAKFVLVDSDTAKCQSALGTCTKRADTCEKSNNECQLAFKKRSEDPDAIIDTMVRAPALANENAQLRQQNKQLQTELNALVELKKKVPDPVRAKAAEDFIAGFETDSKSSVSPKDARKRGEEAARLAKDLADCRGQLTHCVKITGGAKGYGHPPCWTDTAGKVQYVMRVEIRTDGLAVHSAWPPEREADAQQLPGLKSTLEARLQSLDQFKANTLPIFNLSKKAKPECRHYVVIQRDRGLSDIDLFNRLRLGIEDHFYKRDDTAAAQR